MPSDDAESVNPGFFSSLALTVSAANIGRANNLIIAFKDFNLNNY